MSHRTLLALAAWASLPLAARADVTIVDENFDGYADTAAMQAVWKADDGNGFQPLPGPVGVLVPDINAGLTPPNDDPPGIQGKGVNILNDINEYAGPNLSLMESLVPTETQAIRLSMDFFDSATGNKRASAGLRHRRDDAGTVVTTNIVEIGMWNAADKDPRDPSIVEVSTGYAYRVVLFGALGGDLVESPNWGYFPLDPILDRPDDLDELVSVADIGQGWHRYTATIGLEEITFTLDLFRDGLTNSEATEGVGVPGVDSTVTWPIAPFGTGGNIDPFNSLRIGGPSGVTSGFESVVDNIKLELIDLGVGPIDGDFDGNGVVDGADFAAWESQFGDTLDGADLLQWQRSFAPAAVVAAVGVPEPTALSWSVATACVLAARRRR